MNIINNLRCRFCDRIYFGECVVNFSFIDRLRCPICWKFHKRNKRVTDCPMSQPTPLHCRHCKSQMQAKEVTVRIDNFIEDLEFFDNLTDLILGKVDELLVLQRNVANRQVR